tara:strand:+ start:58 stop:876 length:819 start_codon:yes stop_codon:yes gene_type:complete
LQVKSIIQFFINSNIWVAFCVLGLTASSEILLYTTDFKVTQFVFFATIFVYNFQRIVRINQGEDHARKDWLTKNKIAVYLLMLFAVTMTICVAFNFKLNTQIAVFFTAVASILYPFVLRKIPFAKIFIISFVWMVSTMMLLVLESNISISQNVILHLVSRFLFVFAITIPFDIRDLKYDAQTLITIPLFLGASRARLVAVFALFFCGIISVFQYFGSALIFPNLLALILLYFVAAILIVKSDQHSGERHFSFWVESLSIFSYLFLVIILLIF